MHSLMSCITNKDKNQACLSEKNILFQYISLTVPVQWTGIGDKQDFTA